jgi:hypothetical protein
MFHIFCLLDTLLFFRMNRPAYIRVLATGLSGAWLWCAPLGSPLFALVTRVRGVFHVIPVSRPAVCAPRVAPQWLKACAHMHAHTETHPRILTYTRRKATYRGGGGEEGRRGVRASSHCSWSDEFGRRGAHAQDALRVGGVRTYAHVRQHSPTHTHMC